MTQIQTGNLVRVTNENSQMFRKCGKVVENNFPVSGIGPINVLFHKYDTPHYCFTHEDRIIRFEEAELSVIEEFPLEFRARQVYGRDFWCVVPRKFPFGENSRCMHWACSGGVRAYKRAIINNSGRVLEIDFCEEHFHELNETRCAVDITRDPFELWWSVS